jgi:hypothetical protein
LKSKNKTIPRQIWRQNKTKKTMNALSAPSEPLPLARTLTDFPPGNQAPPEITLAPSDATPLNHQGSATSHIVAPEDVDSQALKKTRDWFAAVQTVSGERRIFDRAQFVTSLHDGVRGGVFNLNTPVTVHAKSQDGKWNETTSPLAQVAKGHFKLRALYEPVWSHAIAGLKWGALVGIGLKLLDTFITLGSVDPSLAMMFLVAVGVCFIRRIGMVAIIVISIVISKFSHANFFMMGMSAALTGSALGCLPGMAIGGAIGLSRKKKLPRATDAKPEPDGLLFKAVVFPGLAGATLWAFYLFVFNPWLASLLSK